VALQHPAWFHSFWSFSPLLKAFCCHWVFHIWITVPQDMHLAGWFWRFSQVGFWLCRSSQTWSVLFAECIIDRQVSQHMDLCSLPIVLYLCETSSMWCYQFPFLGFAHKLGLNILLHLSTDFCLRADILVGDCFSVSLFSQGILPFLSITLREGSCFLGHSEPVEPHS